MNLFRMSRAISAAATLVVAVAMPLMGTPAHSATITINDAGLCNWSFANNTLTCTPAAGGAPVCTVTGQSPAQVGNSVTLTANCPGATGGYVWTTLGTCTNGTSSSTCIAASPVSPSSINFTVRASNASGEGADSTPFPVTWQNTPPFACSLAPAGPVTVGVSLPLTATCSNGQVASASWAATPAGAVFGAGSTTLTTASNTASFPTAGQWLVTATITPVGGGAAVQASASVQANAVQAGAIDCSAQGFSKTLVYDWDWINNPISSLDTIGLPDNAGGFGIGTNGILVIRFTPNPPADNGNVTLVTSIGYPSPNMINEVTMAMTTQPCTLYAPIPGTSTSTAPTIIYGVGTVPLSGFSGQPSAVALTPGIQYFLNVAGRKSVSQGTPNGTPTCVPGGGQSYPYCDVRMTLRKPPGH